jgi:ATP-dependent helicase Lhr and Lhr-like helicase
MRVVCGVSACWRWSCACARGSCSSRRITISKRGASALDELRGEHADVVSSRGIVLLSGRDDVHWWTWAGSRANATLIAALPGVADETQRTDNFRIRLRGAGAGKKLDEALQGVPWKDVLPAISPAALGGLKFSEVLPAGLAGATIAERLADPDGAQVVAGEPRVWATTGQCGSPRGIGQFWG